MEINLSIDGSNELEHISKDHIFRKDINVGSDVQFWCTGHNGKEAHIYAQITLEVIR